MTEGFLHLDNDLEELVACLELSSSLDRLLFWSNAAVDSFPLLKSEDWESACINKRDRDLFESCLTDEATDRTL